MVDPVLDMEGNSYERKALSRWLRVNHQSPISRQPLNEKIAIPNIALQNAIHEFMGEEWVVQRRAELTQEFKEGDGSFSSTLAPSAATTAAHSTVDRVKIDSFLAEIGRELKMEDFRLNHNGVCRFTCRGATFVIEVSETVSGCLVVHTTDTFPVLSEEVKDQLLEMNYLQRHTGKCLRWWAYWDHETTVRLTLSSSSLFFF
jgi:hypothetical protein